MCGLAGIMIFNHEKEKLPLVKKMTDIIAHRGPDGEGLWTNDTNISLGHRRLSIIDLSDGAAQPMLSDNGRYVIIFNGEIYNYLEIKKELADKGFVFRTSSDTEVLLNLFIHKGMDMLNELDGMFAFAIWDNLENKLYCARDKFGEKPFYFYKTGSAFYFASEMKAIFALTHVPGIDHEMLNNYLINDLVINQNKEEQTFYNDICKLSKAHYMVIDKDGKITRQKYYTVNQTRSDLNFEDSRDKFYNLLRNSVSKRLRSDVPVGTSLSGGLDSSVIAFLIDDLLNEEKSEKKNRSFSARFEEIGFSENEYLDCIVDFLKVDNFSVYPTGEIIHQELEKIFYHQEEPFQSASILNQWSVMRLAREEGTTVLLDGQGADELIAGYRWYYWIYLKELYLKSKTAYREELAAARINGFNQNSINFKEWLRLNVGLIDKNVHRIKQMRLKNDPGLTIFSPDFFDLKSSDYPKVKSYSNDLNLTLYDDFNTIVLETLLRFSDRNAMAFSREVRLPFLESKLVDFVFGLPSEYKIKEGWKKYIMRKAFDSKLPDKITWRKDKMGYAAPQDKWMELPENKEYLRMATSYLKSERILKDTAIIDQKSQWKILMIYNLVSFSKRNFNA